MADTSLIRQFNKIGRFRPTYQWAHNAALHWADWLINVSGRLSEKRLAYNAEPLKITITQLSVRWCQTKKTTQKNNIDHS